MPLSRWFASVITTLDIMYPRGFWSMDASVRAMTVSRAARAACRRSRCCAARRLKNVCCVVTRYFGGTLLGPGGLVRAYTAATQAAVAAAQEAGQIVEMTSVVPVDVHVAYPQYEQVLRLAPGFGCQGFGYRLRGCRDDFIWCLRRGSRSRFAPRCASLWRGARRLRSALLNLPSSNGDGRRAFGWIPNAPAVVLLLLPFTRRAALAHRRRSRRHRRCSRGSCGADPCPIRCP